MGGLGDTWSAWCHYFTISLRTFIIHSVKHFALSKYFTFALVIQFTFVHSIPGQCEHGSIRLVGGNYSYEGRVEYCLNGIWGTVCDDFWDFYDAITVCLQLNLTADRE